LGREKFGLCFIERRKKRRKSTRASEKGEEERSMAGGHRKEKLKGIFCVTRFLEERIEKALIVSVAHWAREGREEKEEDALP